MLLLGVALGLLAATLWHRFKLRGRGYPVITRDAPPPLSSFAQYAELEVEAGRWHRCLDGDIHPVARVDCTHCGTL